MEPDSAAKTNETMYQIFKRSFEAIPYHEYWPHAIFMLVLLLTAAWGRRRFLLNTNVIFSLSGLAHAIFPGQSAGLWIEGQLDPVHIETVRAVGMVCLTIVLCNYFLLQSSDETVECAMLLGYIVSDGLSLINIIYSYKYPSKKKFSGLSDENLEWAFFCTFMLFVVSLLFALTKKDWGGYAELPSRRNFHLRLDFLQLFLQGVAWYAFPAVLLKFNANLKSIDGVHAYFARALGSFLVGMGIVSARATNFLKENDKTAILLSHAMGLIMVLASMVACRIWYPGLFANNGNLMTIGFFVLFLANSIIGADFKNFYKQLSVDMRVRSLLKSKHY